MAGSWGHVSAGESVGNWVGMSAVYSACELADSMVAGRDVL